MKFNITPGMTIFVLGFIGLVICLAEGPEQIGSKVPLALLFIFVISFGVIVEMKSKDNMDEFGEMEGNGGFG